MCLHITCPQSTECVFKALTKCCVYIPTQTCTSNSLTYNCVNCAHNSNSAIQLLRKEVCYNISISGFIQIIYFIKKLDECQTGYKFKISGMLLQLLQAALCYSKIFNTDSVHIMTGKHKYKNKFEVLNTTYLK